MSIKFNYTGKVVLVTGSSSGIGAATALMFVRSGAQVVVTGLNEERVTAVAEQCRRLIGKGLGVVADVTKECDMVRLVNMTIKEFGKLNILVNNAGYFGAAAINSRDYVKTCRQVLDTNLFSAIQLTHLCLPHLIKTKGVVVNVSSVAANMSGAKLTPYCMSKCALDMFTKCMAVELGPLGIRVNSIDSGAVRTQLIERIGATKEESDKFWDSYANKYPVGRSGEPEDMATAILYLSSDDSSFITGSCLVADGGHVAANAGWSRIGQIKQDNIE